MQAVQKQPDREVRKAAREEDGQERKKLKKVLQKLLTSVWRCDIITRSREKRDLERRGLREDH